MPVRIVSDPIKGYEQGSASNGSEKKQMFEPMRIGLVNNMPIAAFKATENQFRSVLDSASEGISVDLSLYLLRGSPMALAERHHDTRYYALVDELWKQRLDGLIVTGTEPSTASLRDEPYWQSFTDLLDWSRENTSSAIWSCLAAHAAVLHLDGIERQKNRVKHFGIFSCDRVSDHRLMRNAQPRLSIPHSRWNGIAEQDLFGRGYEILTRTTHAEVDMFVKQENSLFVFLQGHPEYETDTLLREYRRDIGRSVNNGTDAYPQVPRQYFDGATEEAFLDLHERASSLLRNELFDEIATIMSKVQIENTWQPSASLLYRNWLNYCCTRRETSGTPDGLGTSRADYQSLSMDNA